MASASVKLTHHLVCLIADFSAYQASQGAQTQEARLTGAWRPRAWPSGSTALQAVANSCFSREVRNVGYYVKSPNL